MAVENSRLSKNTQIWLRLIMVFITPLFLLGMLEGASYIWERQQANGIFAWELVASTRIKMMYFQSPGAGYSLMKPNQHYEYRGISVDINAHGLRNSAVDYVKPKGVFRILNLGDSIAMGWGIKQEDTYGQILARSLTSQKGTAVETINAGVPGWNPENELAFLEDQGLKYQPDLLLLDLTLPNDIYGPSVLKSQGKSAIIEWLRTNTYFWPFLAIQMRWIEANVKGEPRISLLNPSHETSVYFPLNSNDPKWDQIEGVIQNVRTIAQEHDIPLILVIFPIEFQVDDENYSTLPQEILDQWGEREGLPIVDLLLPFRKACVEKPKGPCSLEDRYLFADVWMHPSALGHQIAANEIMKAIIKLK